MISRYADAVIVVYRVGRRRSLREAREYLQAIHGVPNIAAPLITLVGTGNDYSEDREITKEEGRALAKEFTCRWAETSSLTGRLVRRVFLRLAACVLQQGGARYPRKVSQTEFLNDSRACAEYVGEVWRG